MRTTLSSPFRIGNIIRGQKKTIFTYFTLSIFKLSKSSVYFNEPEDFLIFSLRRSSDFYSRYPISSAKKRIAEGKMMKNELMFSSFGNAEPRLRFYLFGLFFYFFFVFFYHRKLFWKKWKIERME